MTVLRKEDEGYCMPLFAPVYTPREWTDHYAVSHKSVNIVFDANDEAVRYIVPEPLEYVSNRLGLMVAERRQAPALAYAYMAVLFVPVKFQGEVSMYYPIGFASSDELLFSYRELYGIGMVMCDEDSLIRKGGVLTGYVRRHGEIIAKASTFLERRVRPEEVWGDALKNGVRLLQKIPSLDPTKRPIRRIIDTHGPDFAAQHLRASEAWSGRGALELPATVWNLHKLNPVNVITAYYADQNIDYYNVTARVLWEDQG